MKHDEIKNKLLALYDGPLTEQERLLVEEHLPSCLDCQGSVESSRKIAGVLFASPSFSEASEDIFVSKVIARIHSEIEAQAAPSRWNILQWLAPLAGSAVAAAWVFFFVLPGTPGLSTASDFENFFTGEETASVSSSAEIVPAAYSPEDIVVALIK